MPLEIVRLHLEDQSDRDAWQDYIGSLPDSHLADRAEWRLLFRDLYGIEDDTFLCLEDGRAAGALSLYHIRSPFMGNMLVTSPFFGQGGLHAGSAAVREALLERALEAARARRAHYVELRLADPVPGFEANTAFSEFVLELGATPEDTWREQLSANVRQNVRKARTHALELRLSADPGPCFELLRRTLRAHGTPFHGRRFFELLGRYLGESVRYSEVWSGDEIVAGGVVIRHRDTVLTPYIGSLEGFRALRPNYLQYWGIIEHAHATGARRFDFGRSPRGSTHAQFKRKWGAEERPVVYSYRVLSPRHGYKTVSEPSPVFRLAAAVWRRMPLALTTAAGPRLFRYIP